MTTQYAVIDPKRKNGDHLFLFTLSSSRKAAIAKYTNGKPQDWPRLKKRHGIKTAQILLIIQS